MASFAFSRVPVKRLPVRSQFRSVQTALPVPESLPILDDLARYELRSMHGQVPIVWDRAKDFQVFDRWGNVWIDFTSTIFVTNAGSRQRSHPPQRMHAAIDHRSAAHLQLRNRNPGTVSQEAGGDRARAVR